MKNVCLCVHGHFYQPPRENAWIEEVDPQESAQPFRDWNERIHYESYSPNTRARVYDRHALIVDLVNNFEKMSFNVGPTLMSWLEAKHPATYQRIIEADQVSRDLHKGHGNALAQVYNHMIMPLANQRDKKTQVLWGIEEFRYRFGRDPEGMWLPETACNEETLEVLVDEGIKFTILEPHQAEAVRSFGGDWQDVSHGEIDPKRPYRCFLKKDPSRFIDLFFFDGPISRAVGFEDLLKDAKNILGRVEGAVVQNGGEPQLINLATDGETYGHHKPFGDRVLAYLLHVSGPSKGFRVVNYGEFLEENPPRYEVRLKSGENGEGTSWSCGHGVRRWKDHCGCRGGGPGEWNQHWRKPLREALDWLRDELAKLYESQGSLLLKDVWEARDHYIHVILRRDPAAVENFFFRFRQRYLTQEEVTTCLKFLEIERYAQLMYTSCGWFFTEISGIETVQILQYAARAIQLAVEITGVSLEDEFLNRLSRAKSNMTMFRDGKGVYETLVKPSVASLEKIVSCYAIGALFENYYPETEKLKLYCYDIERIASRKETFGNLSAHFGHVRIVSKVTLEEKNLIFSVVQIGLYDFHCSVKPFAQQAEYERLEAKLFDNLFHGDILELLRTIETYSKVSHFTLKDLFLEDRMKIISLLTHEQIEKISKFYERIYDESHRINSIYRSINLPIPVEFCYAAQHVLSKRLLEETKKMASEGFLLRKASLAIRILETAKLFHVEIHRAEVQKYLSAELQLRIKQFVEEPRPELIRECLNILKTAEKFGMHLEYWQAQDDLFFFLKKWRDHPHLIPQIILTSSNPLIQLMNRLHLGFDELRKHLLKSSA